MSAPKPAENVTVIGSGVAALLLALELQARGISVALVPDTPSPEVPPAHENPELAPMWGDEALPGLFHQSLGLWKTVSERLSLPQLLAHMPFADLALSEGREVKLQEEALLDALGGEEISYIKQVPPGVQAKQVYGVKSWPNAPVFNPGLWQTLRDATIARNIPWHSAPIARLSLPKGQSIALVLEDGSTVTSSHLVITSAPSARKLAPFMGADIPLRPARSHRVELEWTPPPMPENQPPLYLCRLGKGHLFAVPRPSNALVLFYDALLDPLQATNRRVADYTLAQVISTYAQSVFQGVSSATPSNVEPFIHWVAPDFLPLYGPHPEHASVYFAIGWAARENAFAAAIAHQLTCLFDDPELAPSPAEEFAPVRFKSGLWKRTEKPGSLTWREAELGQGNANLAVAPIYMENVKTVTRPDPKYAETVVQTEQAIQVAEKKMPEIREKSKKPRVQMASLPTK